MVFTQACTFNVLDLGAANIAIGPLFVSIGNDHPMVIDAEDTATSLAVQKNDAIDNFVSDTPTPAVVSSSRVGSARRGSGSGGKVVRDPCRRQPRTRSSHIALFAAERGGHQSRVATGRCSIALKPGRLRHLIREAGTASSSFGQRRNKAFSAQAASIRAS
jgi:hypothetical protein